MGQPKIKKDIEARVMDTGDTMTGDLNIITNSKPTFRAINEGTNQEGIFQSLDEGTLQIVNYEDGDNYNALYIRKHNYELKDSLLFVKKTPEGLTPYTILHTGNSSDYTLPKSGGILTGNLTIKKDNNSSLYLYNNTTTAQAVFQQLDSETLQILNYYNGNNYSGIYISKYTTSLNNIFRLVHKVDGTATQYNILHQGNMSSYVLPLTGGTLTGNLVCQKEIQLSFKNAVAMGSYQANATTIPALAEEVRYSSGCMGSFQLNTAYSGIPTGWYNFLYVPHRSGGTNGSPNGDNHNYGTLTLYGMTVEGQHWRIRYNNGICETKRIWNQGDSVTSAVWNDYAEYRESKIIEPGYVLTEAGDDTLILTSERLQSFAGVSSDTWGFSQGETEKAKTPIAVAGRVLVYPAEDRNIYQPGDCVCAGPGGTVSKMTRQEIIEWPDRIVGKVSCVPEYEEWGGGENADRKSIKINGRIWIQVK